MNHTRHIVIPAVIWAVLAILLNFFVIVRLAWPPGYQTNVAADQSVEGQVFGVIATTVFLAVVVFAIYFLIVFRSRGDETGHGPVIYGNFRVQLAWLVGGAVLVLFAAGYGTAMLEGQTTPSLIVPASMRHAQSTRHPLVIQVIAQQWQFTFRYPTLGDFESPLLRMPDHRLVQFDVTSLDVEHSFWPFNLGVKIDAIPGANNVGYVYAPHPSKFVIECAELCGLWHTYMRDFGKDRGEVLSQGAFASWVRGARRLYGPQTRYLPKFALVYYPSPTTY